MCVWGGSRDKNTSEAECVFDVCTTQQRGGAALNREQVFESRPVMANATEQMKAEYLH